jgi:hypothetical protein
VATYSSAHKNIAYLDGIRNRNGLENLKGEFHEIANNDPDKACKLLNDPNMRFPTLFVLQPEIKKCDLHEHLNTRNTHALDLVNDILTGTIPVTYKEKLNYYPTLKWMMETGYASDGLNDHYDEVMDKVALMLTRVHRDKTCLRYIEEIIFNRHRKGFFIYDMVWAFFESSEPEDLTLIAHRLRSINPKDVELARQLLNFIPGINAGYGNDPMKQYKHCTNWIHRNRNSMQYTGESFQQNSNPSRYAVVTAQRARGGSR